MKRLPEDQASFLAPTRKSNQPFTPKKSFDDFPAASVGFTSGGRADESCPTCDINDDACYAKKLVFSDNSGLIEKYFVKFNSQGHMFDPWGPMMEGTQSKFDKWHGKPQWEFLEINKRAFEFYKTFLQTRNKAWKQNAEREVNNG